MLEEDITSETVLSLRQRMVDKTVCRINIVWQFWIVSTYYSESSIGLCTEATPYFTRGCQHGTPGGQVAMDRRRIEYSLTLSVLYCIVSI